MTKQTECYRKGQISFSELRVRLKWVVSLDGSVCVCERESGVCDMLAEERQGDAAVLACAPYYSCWPTNSNSLRQMMNISLHVYGVKELTVSHWNASEIPEK